MSLVPRAVSKSSILVRLLPVKWLSVRHGDTTFVTVFLCFYYKIYDICYMGC